MTVLEQRIAELLPLGTRKSEGEVFAVLWGDFRADEILPVVRRLEAQKMLMRRFARDPETGGIRSTLQASHQFLQAAVASPSPSEAQLSTCDTDESHNDTSASHAQTAHPQFSIL